MIKIKLKNNTDIQIEGDDRQYIQDLRETFSFYAPGYQFMPRYRNTGWNGKICLVTNNNTLAFGLFFDLLKWHKKKYKTLPLEVDSKVKSLFMGKKLKPKYNLKYIPRDYQDDCIKTILEHTKCITKVATASGKSLIIAYVIKTLLEKFKDKQYLIIVPTVNLVEQFYGDLIDYGMDANIIGRVYSNIKEPDKPIVISTWQSLQNNHDWLDRFHGVCVDEVHIASGGIEIKKILQKAVNAVYKFGVTGTLPANKLELFSVKSYLGPVVRNYSASDLADDGYISHIGISAHLIQHPSAYEGEYFEIRENVFNYPPRMEFIKNLIEGIGQENILILVSLVEKEGIPLTEYLTEHLPDREVTFIYGNTKVNDREIHRHEFGEKHNKVVVATYPIFKLGVNVPSLKYIMLASPLKSKISVLQSVGRVLRLHANKVNGAYVIDLIDKVPYLYSHGEARLKYYRKEKFDIQEHKISLPKILFTNP